MKNKYKIEPPEDWLVLEEQLRAAAPELPPALRSRTLAACATHRAKRTTGHYDKPLQGARRGSTRLVWALAGLCVFQWIIVVVLDSEQTALIKSATSTTLANNEQPFTKVTLAQYPDKSPNLWGILQARSHAYAGLLAICSEQVSLAEAG